jgi:phage gp36-like protein
MNVCQIAAFFLMTFRGYRPGGADEVVRLRYEDAIRWCRDIAGGLITPAGIFDSAPTRREGAPDVVSGAVGNLVGGSGTPSVTLGVRPYPFTGTVPGRRGW